MENLGLRLSKDGRARQAWFDPRNKSEGKRAHHGVGAKLKSQREER